MSTKFEVLVAERRDDTIAAIVSRVKISGKPISEQIANRLIDANLLTAVQKANVVMDVLGTRPAGIGGGTGAKQAAVTTKQRMAEKLAKQAALLEGSAKTTGKKTTVKTAPKPAPKPDDLAVI